MATDFNAGLTDVRTHEAKLTVSSGRMAQFAYDSTAYQDDTAEGTATYNFGNHQNIPLGNAGTLNVDGQILDKGVRSQASSITRMMMNHFFGRASYNVNKMADYMKVMLDTLLVFMREGSNAWSPTASYVAGDLVYYVHTINGVSTKRTFFCKEASTNKPPVDATTGALINTSYWGEINVGNTTINGDLNVNGNIYQNGHDYQTHAEQLFTKKDMIYTREGAVAGLATGVLTGIIALLYDGVKNGVLGFDNTGTARVGDEGDTQPLLTRAESNALANGHVLAWDATNKRAIDSGRGITDSVNQGDTNLVSSGAVWNKIVAMFPVGTIYQNALDSTNPATLLGFGVWVQITDKFLASKGAQLTDEAGGIVGNFSYSLTYANIPQHQHEMQHTHTISHTHTQQGTFPTLSQSESLTTTENANHSHSANIGVVFADGDNLGIAGGQAELYIPNISGISSGGWVNVPATTYGNYTVPLGAAAGRSNVYRMLSLNVNMGVESASHKHQLVHGHNLSISGNTTEPSTPNSGNASREYTGYWGEPTVTAINTTPPYQAVYTWYRSA